MRTQDVYFEFGGSGPAVMRDSVTGEVVATMQEWVMEVTRPMYFRYRDAQLGEPDMYTMRMQFQVLAPFFFSEPAMATTVRDVQARALPVDRKLLTKEE